MIVRKIVKMMGALIVFMGVSSPRFFSTAFLFQFHVFLLCPPTFIANISMVFNARHI